MINHILVWNLGYVLLVNILSSVFVLVVNDRVLNDENQHASFFSRFMMIFLPLVATMYLTHSIESSISFLLCPLLQLIWFQLPQFPSDLVIMSIFYESGIIYVPVWYLWLLISMYIVLWIFSHNYYFLIFPCNILCWKEVLVLISTFHLFLTCRSYLPRTEGCYTREIFYL